MGRVGGFTNELREVVACIGGPEEDADVIVREVGTSTLKDQTTM